MLTILTWESAFKQNHSTVLRNLTHKWCSAQWCGAPLDWTGGKTEGAKSLSLALSHSSSPPLLTHVLTDSVMPIITSHSCQAMIATLKVKPLLFTFKERDCQDAPRGLLIVSHFNLSHGLEVICHREETTSAGDYVLHGHSICDLYQLQSIFFIHVEHTLRKGITGCGIDQWDYFV